MTLSVVTASTWPFFSASAHLEYTSNVVSAAPGKLSRMFCAGVEPSTEHTFLPARASGPSMPAGLPAATMMSWPAS